MIATNLRFLAISLAVLTFGLLLQGAQVSAASWVPVGSAGFSSGGTGHNTMAMARGGQPVVAYADTTKAGKLTVKRFNGTSWVTLGAEGISADAVRRITLHLDNINDVVYVIYSHSLDNKVFAKKFAKNAWTNLGGEISTGDYSTLAVAKDGTIFAAVAYATAPKEAGIDQNYADGIMIKKFSNGAWIRETVYYATPDEGRFTHPVLKFDYNNRGLLAYCHHNINLLERSTTSWKMLNTNLQGLAQVLHPLFTSLAFDASNKFYVAVVGSAPSVEKVVVVKNLVSYMGSREGFSKGNAMYVSLACESSDVPWAAYTDMANGSRATVKKFTNGSWTTVGPEGFTKGTAMFTSLAFFAATSEPFVSFSDGSLGGKASVYVYR